MKRTKTFFITMAAILMCGLLLTCQKENNDPVATDNEVAFAINISNLKSASQLKSAEAYNLADADKIVLTIQNSDGSATKYTSEEIKIQEMNGVYYTQKIVLKTGNYQLTAFTIIDNSDSTIFATPLAGSQQAQNVTNPLPILFSVTKDATTYVDVEVLSTEKKTPEDFGLNSFPIIEVKTFGFMIGVTDSESDELLAATITVSNGSWSYVQNLNSVVNNVVTVKDGLSNYTLEIEMNGYITYNHTYPVDSLKMHKDTIGNLPLVVELVNDPNQINLSAWITALSFNVARTSHACAEYNGYLYIIGGSNAGGLLYDVQFAKINSNGSLGSWQNTTSLNNARNQSACVAYNGYLYVIGGTGPSTATNTVQYAQINADGSLGAWQSASSMNLARQSFGCVISNNKLYVIQGFYYSAASPVSDVEFTTFNADGSLGTWQTTTTFSPARWGHESVVYNGFIYSMGGSNWNGSYYSLNDVKYSLIDINGNLNTWQNATSLNSTLDAFCLVEYNGFLIITGGVSSSVFLNQVQYSKINPDGSLGTWLNTNSLNTARYSHTSVIYNGYLYVLGGTAGNGTILNDVQYAKLN